MKTLLILNGPPGSGKDWTASWLLERYNGIRMPLAKVLKEKTHQFFDLMDNGGKPRAYNYYENVKDQALPDFHGLSPRQAYIWMSEQVIKPKFGQDYFGRLWVQKIVYMKDILPELVIITDCGFQAEFEAIASRFAQEKAAGFLSIENIVLVQLTAPNCSFQNDSRNYVNIFYSTGQLLKSFKINHTQFTWVNSKTPEYEETLRQFAQAYL